jgi:hypothetical protein
MKLFGRHWTPQEIDRSAEVGARHYWESSDYIESEEQDSESVGIEYARKIGMSDPSEIADYAAKFGSRVRTREDQYDQSDSDYEAKPKF